MVNYLVFKGRIVGPNPDLYNILPSSTTDPFITLKLQNPSRPTFLNYITFADLLIFGLLNYDRAVALYSSIPFKCVTLICCLYLVTNIKYMPGNTMPTRCLKIEHIE